MPDIILDKQGNEKLWDGVAPTFQRVGPHFDQRFGNRLIELTPIDLGESVLDIATGTGAVLFPAARRVGVNGHATGIDVSSKMIEIAKNSAISNGLNNVDFLKMDAERLEFPDQSFNAVTCGFGIFFFADMNAALHEMYRVCKPGGYIGFSVFNKTPPTFSPGSPLLRQQLTTYKVPIIRPPHPNNWTPEEIKVLLEPQGFRSIVVQNEILDGVFANTEEWWEYVLSMGGIGATIMTMDEETRARFKDEYFAKLQPMMNPDGLHIAVGAVYAIAQK
jgi:ubiquinone/menaquinone biosynthesis C-methylase UbiE